MYIPNKNINKEKQKLDKVKAKLKSTLSNKMYLKFSIIELTGFIE